MAGSCDVYVSNNRLISSTVYISSIKDCQSEEKARCHFSALSLRNDMCGSTSPTLAFVCICIVCLLVLLIQPVSAQGIETNGHQEGDDKFLLNGKHIFIGTIEVSQMDLKYILTRLKEYSFLLYFH